MQHCAGFISAESLTVLHQVGVSFDLYYDARKHKIKIKYILLLCFHLNMHGMAWIFIMKVFIPVEKCKMCNNKLCQTSLRTFKI